jgi:hypothetical protein
MVVVLASLAISFFFSAQRPFRSQPPASSDLQNCKARTVRYALKTKNEGLRRTSLEFANLAHFADLANFAISDEHREQALAEFELALTNL